MIWRCTCQAEKIKWYITNYIVYYLGLAYKVCVRLL